MRALHLGLEGPPRYIRNTGATPLTKHLILGIDPGLTGGIALYSMIKHELVFVKAMPVKATHQKHHAPIDLKAIARFIDPYTSRIRFAAIEDVHSMPNNGPVQAFKFGFATGLLHGICETLGLKVLPVSPAVWKCALNLGKNKKQSLALAQKLFPKDSEEFLLSKDDGKAEAALIARYVANSLPVRG